jgi:hypothetical protein
MKIVEVMIVSLREGNAGRARKAREKERQRRRRRVAIMARLKCAIGAAASRRSLMAELVDAGVDRVPPAIARRR